LPLLVQQEPEQKEEQEQEQVQVQERELKLVPWPELLGRSASLALAESGQVKIRLGQIESQEKPTPQLKWELIAVPGWKAPRWEYLAQLRPIHDH